MEDKIYRVYIHTNKINNRRYVGMTSLKPQTRWKKGQGYDRQPHFYKDIKAYGWDSFEHTVVYETTVKQDAQRVESELIKKYETRDPEKGYNLNCGDKDENGNPIKKNYYELYKQNGIITHGTRKRCYCLELDTVYPCALEAERQLGIASSNIGRCCKGILKSAGKHPETGEKLHWQYVD